MMRSRVRRVRAGLAGRVRDPGHHACARRAPGAAHLRRPGRGQDPACRAREEGPAARARPRSAALGGRPPVAAAGQGEDKGSAAHKDEHQGEYQGQGEGATQSAATGGGRRWWRTSCRYKLKSKQARNSRTRWISSRRRSRRRCGPVPSAASALRCQSLTSPLPNRFVRPSSRQKERRRGPGPRSRSVPAELEPEPRAPAGPPPATTAGPRPPQPQPQPQPESAGQKAQKAAGTRSPRRWSSSKRSRRRCGPVPYTSLPALRCQ